MQQGTGPTEYYARLKYGMPSYLRPIVGLLLVFFCGAPVHHILSRMESNISYRRARRVLCKWWRGFVWHWHIMALMKWGLDKDKTYRLGGALSAVRAQCNYLGVWPY